MSGVLGALCDLGMKLAQSKKYQPCFELLEFLATRKSAADDPVSTTFFGLVESLVGDLDEGFDNIVRLQLGGGQPDACGDIDGGSVGTNQGLRANGVANVGGKLICRLQFGAWEYN